MSNYFIPLKQPPISRKEAGSQYSEAAFRRDEDGVATLHLRNACLDTQTAFIHLYCREGDCDSLRSECSRLPPSLHSAQWQFAFHAQPQPQTNRIDKRGCYLLQHTADSSLEVVSFLSHFIHNHKRIPAIGQLILPHIDLAADPLLTLLLEGIKASFPAFAVFRVFAKSELEAIAPVVCYSSLVPVVVWSHDKIGVGQLQWISEGGSFLSAEESQWVRAAAYKHYATARPERRLKSIRVLMAVPESIEIQGMDAIRTYFQRNGNWWYFEKELRSLGLEEELSIMMDTDVLISVVGRDLYHMILLLPGSAVIAYSQPYVHDYSFQALAEVAGLQYYPVFNSSVPLPATCRDTMEATNCREALRKQSVFIHYGQLHNYMRIAAVHVQMKKYGVLVRDDS
ncbi:hypothetical protein BLSTO_04444 [Blastocystis sp. subtype 1]